MPVETGAWLDIAGVFWFISMAGLVVGVLVALCESHWISVSVQLIVGAVWTLASFYAALFVALSHYCEHCNSIPASATMIWSVVGYAIVSIAISYFALRQMWKKE